MKKIKVLIQILSNNVNDLCICDHGKDFHSTETQFVNGKSIIIHTHCVMKCSCEKYQQKKIGESNVSNKKNIGLYSK